MSRDPHDDNNGAHTIRAKKGGGGGKFLLAAVTAAALIGGGYYAWTRYAPASDQSQVAYNDQYPEDQYASEPLRAGPVEPAADLSADTATDDSASDTTVAASTETAPAPTRQRTTTARTATARTTTPRTQTAEAIPTETIGITPASATIQESDEIIVTAPRRPVWTRVPNERRLSALYPAVALERGRDGEASLRCIVQDNGALACQRETETSASFGHAAMRVARTYRHAPTLADGSTAAGTPVNLRVLFRMSDEARQDQYASR